MALRKGQARKHHVVSSFHLAGFTNDRGDQYVFDLKRRKSWPSRPDENARITDFNRVEGENPMVVEEKLAKAEARWSGIIRETIRNRVLPSGEDFDELMMFVAFMETRTPRFRANILQFLHEAGKLDALLLKHHRERGEDIESTFEDELAKLDQSWLVDRMVKCAAGTVFPCIVDRPWGLWWLKDGEPDFVCSDSPLAMTWDLGIERSAIYPPGFGHRNIMLTIPLDKRTMLFSSWVPLMLAQNADGVAYMNARTIHLAGQVYCPSRDAVYRQDEKITPIADLIGEAA